MLPGPKVEYFDVCNPIEGPPRDGAACGCGLGFSPRDYLLCLATCTRYTTRIKSGSWAISSLPKEKPMKILSRSFAFGLFPGTWLRDFLGAPWGSPSHQTLPRRLKVGHSHTRTRSPVTGHGAKHQRFPFRYSQHCSKALLFWYSHF